MDICPYLITDLVPARRGRTGSFDRLDNLIVVLRNKHIAGRREGAWLSGFIETEYFEELAEADGARGGSSWLHRALPPCGPRAGGVHRDGSQTG